jgi:hypothetical protein
MTKTVIGLVLPIATQPVCGWSLTSLMNKKWKKEFIKTIPAILM